jgi:hypothetical protein
MSFETASLVVVHGLTGQPGVGWIARRTREPFATTP